VLLCAPRIVSAPRKPKLIHIATPHPQQGQEIFYLTRKDYDNPAIPNNLAIPAPAIPKGLIEKRGTVVVGISHAQLWERKPAGHYYCTIFLIVANEDPEKELPVSQDYFFAHDGQTGRYWALLSEERERAILLGQSAPTPYAPPPPPPSYTVWNSDGSSSNITPQPDGISQAGQAIANAIERRSFQKYQEKELKRLDTHFHDALLQPHQIISGWLTIYGVTMEHPLRLVLYVGTERFVFIFGPEIQEYEYQEKPKQEKAKPLAHHLPQ